MSLLIATVALQYTGGVNRQDIQELLENALEHCRQESMLTPDPASDTQSCDWVSVRHIEEA